MICLICDNNCLSYSFHEECFKRKTYENKIEEYANVIKTSKLSKYSYCAECGAEFHSFREVAVQIGTTLFLFHSKCWNRLRGYEEPTD